MAIPEFKGRKLLGEFRQTGTGETAFLSTKRLKAKGDIVFGLAIDPSPAWLARKIAGIPRRFRSWKPAWTMLVVHLASGIRRNMTQRGEGDWAAPNKVYVSRKLRGGFGSVPLRRTGRLYARAGDVITMTDSKVSVGVKNLRYARANHFGFGTAASSTKTGRRAYAYMNRGMKRKAVDVMNAFAAKMMTELSAEIEKEARAA